MLALALSTLAVTTTGAMAQLALPTELFGLSLSTQCQAAVIGAVTAPDFATCFPLADVLPALTSNDSIAPYLDNFMSDLCYEQPCSQETLDAASQAVIAGCSSDLQKDGFSDSVVTQAFNAYPLVRQLLCTKTSEPYTEESYGGFLGEPPVAIDSGVYNSTDGYFCVTSLLTQLSAYFGADLSVPYITAAASGQNQTTIDLLTSIQPDIICNDCIFAMVDIINQAYPAAGDFEIATAFGLLNMTSPLPAGTTINSYANETCAYNNQSVSTDGTLPETITVSIVNSTFTA